MSVFVQIQTAFQPTRPPKSIHEGWDWWTRASFVCNIWRRSTVALWNPLTSFTWWRKPSHGACYSSEPPRNSTCWWIIFYCVSTDTITLISCVYRQKVFQYDARANYGGGAFKSSHRWFGVAEDWGDTSHSGQRGPVCTARTINTLEL